MPDVVTCPMCGERFSGAGEDDMCPACLQPLQRIHEHSRRTTDEILSTRDLTGPERAIEELMRRNKGVSAS